jgi:hypothetical protein
VWIGVIAAAFAVSGKVTALWPLFGLAAAGALAGWRPPPLRLLWKPALAAAPLFAPMVGFAISGPATAGEVNRRLEFLSDLFTRNVIGATAVNLVAYLGSWGSVMSHIVLGPDARAPNVFGKLLVIATLVWLVVRALGPGTLPRRRRLEAQMLAHLAVVFLLVALFFRERQDYQFLILVPLHALAVAAFLDWLAARFLDRRMPAWAAGLLICLLPLASHLWEQRGVRDDLSRARNAMADLSMQRESAAWLAANGARRPIVVTFYSVGSYEIFTDAAVRPVYAFPLFRHPKTRQTVPDYPKVWRDLLADAEEPQIVLLPEGLNPVEATHFDEPAIRAAFLEVAPHAERAAVFSNSRGEPLIVAWRLPSSATVDSRRSAASPSR